MTHWHREPNGGPSTYLDLAVGMTIADCCLSAINAAETRACDRARATTESDLRIEFAERIREALAYIDQIRSTTVVLVATPDVRDAAIAVAGLCRDAIAKTVCTCPYLDTSTLGGRASTTKGLDPACPTHGATT